MFFIDSDLHCIKPVLRTADWMTNIVFLFCFVIMSRSEMKTEAHPQVRRLNKVQSFCI